MLDFGMRDMWNAPALERLPPMPHLRNGVSPLVRDARRSTR
jgi:hypothetical protein